MVYILFYRPPCGKWYVHSHKLYPSKKAAYDAALEYLGPGTPVAVLPVEPAALDRLMTRIK